MLRFIAIASLAAGLIVPAATAQDPERDAQDLKQGRIALIDAGTPIPVRVQEDIKVKTRDERVYPGMVDQDVRDAKGHIVIPRGSAVDLKVRAEQGNQLVLDIEDIDVNTQHFGIWSEADRVEAERADSPLTKIVDHPADAEVEGSQVSVPCDSVLTFRIEHAMIVGLILHDPGEPLYARQNLSRLR
ncbi:MAG TPA: hypothetical protein VGG72_09340 [Bryobacteraceae bacterium]|jgi:hypothetical protein